jgi:hypothetical protein
MGILDQYLSRGNPWGICWQYRTDRAGSLGERAHLERDAMQYGATEMTIDVDMTNNRVPYGLLAEIEGEKND